MGISNSWVICKDFWRLITRIPKLILIFGSKPYQQGQWRLFEPNREREKIELERKQKKTSLFNRANR